MEEDQEEKKEEEEEELKRRFCADVQRAVCVACILLMCRCITRCSLSRLISRVLFFLHLPLPPTSKGQNRISSSAQYILDYSSLVALTRSDETSE